MKLIRIFKYFVIGTNAFIATGTLILNPAEIQNEFSFPENSIQYGKGNEEDSSGFSSDGPIIIYENGNIINYSIIPDLTGYTISNKQINKSDTLICNINETRQKFSFLLKDTINTENDVYELPDKMLIISDIEGNFRGFKLILKGAGVINEDFDWTFGNGHLVLAGDFFDRGINVTECLWLIYKLESEAELQGGKVHFIMGNHEMMNLKEKYRYVRTKYFINADSLNLEYKNWYTANSELGNWLRSKNGIEKIGDYLFLHAGISKNFPKDTFSLSEINNNIRVCIDKVYIEGEASKDIFIGNDSPLWYRGIVKEEEAPEDIEKTLDSFSVEKMILGHTIVDQIKYLYNQKVIAIDLEHKVNSDNDTMYALWFENGNFFIIDNNGLKSDLK